MQTQTTAPTPIVSAVQITMAIAEAIRLARQIPSGELYAMLMPTGMSLELYEAVIATLCRSGIITNHNHLLTWAMPEIVEDAQ